jgi:hypothetical protein
VNPKPCQLETWKRTYADIPIRPLDELYALPEPQEFDAGIYFLWKDNALIYIGKSRNMLGRMSYQVGVNRTHPFAESITAKHIPFDKITCLVIEKDARIHSPRTDGAMEAHERAYLAHYRPYYNVDAQNGFT